MADHIPDVLERAHQLVAGTIDKQRHALRASLAGIESDKRYDRQKVVALYEHAVADPDPRSLAELLCSTVPTQFLTIEAMVLQVSAPPTSPDGSQAQGERLLKLRAAVLEAGLVEQMTPDLRVRDGDALCAKRLEHSLDEWVRAGRHRGAEFDDAPLSLIAKTIEATEASTEGQMMTRFGLVMPVLMAVHIWRSLQELSDSEAVAAGWHDTALGEAESPGTPLNNGAGIRPD